MSPQLETSAEILKFARLIDVDPAQLDYLDSVPAEELRALRESVTNSIFDASEQTLKRIAAGAKLIPAPLIATIARKSFGPLLCARAAGAIDPAKALDIAKRLPADFLADVTVQLDPRRVAKIISRVPEALVVPVATQLGKRDEHVTMGRFLAYLPDQAVVAAMAILSDENLLRTAFVLENKDHLDHALGLLPPKRLHSIIANASQLGLWPEALDLLDNLSDARRGPVADVVADQEPEVIENLVAAVTAAEIWENLLPVVEVMSDAHRFKIASAPAFHQSQVLDQIIHAASATSQWVQLLPLIDALPDKARRIAANLVAGLDEESIAGLVDAVTTSHLWPKLLPVVRMMSDQSRSTMAAMAPFHQESVLRDILTTAASSGLWVDLVPLLRVLPTTAFAQLPPLVAELPNDDLVAIATEAIESVELLEPFVEILSHMDHAVQQSIVHIIESDDGSLERVFVDALKNPHNSRLLLDNTPVDILDAIERAADRHGLRAELDAAIRAANPS